MKSSMTPLKMLAMAFAGLMIAGAFLMASVSARATADDDAAAVYKTKCAACHGAAAEKKFDATLAEGELIQAILNGKKPEKPPNMPAYGDKGVTTEQAKGLVEYMKQLKAAQ